MEFPRMINLCSIKIIILSTSFLFFLGIFGCGSSSNTKVSDVKNSKSDIKVVSFDLFTLDSTRIESNELGVKYLGNISAGEVIVGSFDIVNKIGGPVVIFDIRGICGCLSFDYDSRPINIDASKRINYRYDSKGKKGKQYSHVRIESSEGEYIIKMECDVQ